MENLNEQTSNLKGYYEHERNRLVLKDKISNIKIAMLNSIDHEGVISSRPMYTQEIKDDGILWFFGSKSSKLASDLQQNPNVNLNYNDHHENIYVSVAGLATLSNDLLKIDELWSEMYIAWFPEGKSDPDLTLIKVEVTHAEYWDTPNSKIAQLIGFVKASLTGKPYEPGTNEKFDL
jgi:general stress protein 26